MSTISLKDVHDRLVELVRLTKDLPEGGHYGPVDGTAFGGKFTEDVQFVNCHGPLPQRGFVDVPSPYKECEVGDARFGGPGIGMVEVCDNSGGRMSGKESFSNALPFLPELTDDSLIITAREQCPRYKTPHGGPVMFNMTMYEKEAWMDGFVSGGKHTRDKGYITPAKPFPVDAVMEVVDEWLQANGDDVGLSSAERDLRARLTAKFGTP